MPGRAFSSLFYVLSFLLCADVPTKLRCLPERYHDIRQGDTIALRVACVDEQGQVMKTGESVECYIHYQLPRAAVFSCLMNIIPCPELTMFAAVGVGWPFLQGSGDHKSKFPTFVLCISQEIQCVRGHKVSTVPGFKLHVLLTLQVDYLVSKYNFVFVTHSGILYAVPVRLPRERSPHYDYMFETCSGQPCSSA